MQLGMIGLGRMGANMVRRLRKHGHDCVVYDVHADAVSALESEGATGAASPAAFVKALARPRAVWMMVPAGVVDATLADLLPLLEPDGLMIGGEEPVVRRLDPIFKSLAPGMGGAPRTPGREQLGGTAEHGYLHCGPSGAGHFVKMVHNGIEYGLMAAYAEGFNILRHANVGASRHATDAETTPLRHPEHYRYDLPLHDIAEVWRRGSVVASWLLDLTASALVKSGDLATFSGRVSDSGEGRWTVQAAIESSVPAPVLSAALYQRFSSRGEDDFATKLLSALRFEFGGHHEKPAEGGSRRA
jgi:6-phosphogluconate dehydrogenase